MTQTIPPVVTSCTSCLFGRLVPAPFLIGGLLFAGMGLRNLVVGKQSRDWPAVPGTITRAEVKQRTRRQSNGRSSTGYSLRVEYEYVVDGTLWTNDRVRYGATSYKRRGDAERDLANYRVGSETSVFHRPDDPQQSVLRPGVGGGVCLFIALGSLFSVGGAFSMVLLPRIMKRKLLPPAAMSGASQPSISFRFGRSVE